MLQTKGRIERYAQNRKNNLSIKATMLEQSILFIFVILILGNILGEISLNLIIVSIGTLILYSLLLEWSIKRYDKEAEAIYLAVGISGIGFALSFLFIAIRAIKLIGLNMQGTMNVILLILCVISMVVVLIIPFFIEKKEDIKVNKKAKLGQYAIGPILVIGIGKIVKPLINQSGALEIVFLCCLLILFFSSLTCKNIIVYFCMLKIKNDKKGNREVVKTNAGANNNN